MLYMALPVDLRDRYKGSEWLAYARRIDEFPWQAGDTLVVCEWMIQNRHSLLQTLGRVSQRGARVVFVGSNLHESDAFKRDLCLVGVYDFLFVGEELVLQELDDLLAHPRSQNDVVAYLQEDMADVLTPPQVIDVFTGEGDPFSWAPLREEGEARFDTLVQEPAVGSPRSQGTQGDVSPVRRFIWPTPSPVRVQIQGDHGGGKSFLALQLLSLCHANELPAALVEEDATSLQAWCEPRLADHVMTEEPPPGYRVIIDTRPDVGASDLILVITWPGASILPPSPSEPEIPVVWVVNHHTPGVLWSTPADIDCILIPHEPRQFHAMRMKTPLVELDPTFAMHFQPLIERIAARFVDPDRRPIFGGDEHVVAARA
ncbi:hypothetical protein [Ferroacidibacillus organovorans]|uniref:Uncharacterized protein n=1 Tax=Ferroacidibacillus organovorans TaxID=1765683 RepID=A0A162S5A7_9BACL|nr:hypothetical protein [Ferroacidibacillus organovorans]KYP79535.1 hypothetical protein AYJ22_14495 [Ferroacidibacillus organovorans]OAG91091.1 hypothetical protein AYW79_13960 [Ferroacidibacillus organovorans]OPG17121.1 hypothetical protein B2M26_03165 [Ferroacidibacillus organovorans]